MGKVLRAVGLNKKSSDPGAPTKPEEPKDAKTEPKENPTEAAERVRRESRSKGRKTTVLTSPQGLREPATTSKRTLLGA